MDKTLIDIQLPASLYEKLQTLATEEQTDPVSLIAKFVTEAYQHRRWLQDLIRLRQQIQNENDPQLSNTKEEIITQLRQSREEIFETEYAHLYR
jgi:hypothetical protein